MISLDPNWHDCDVLGHLFITSQFNWPRALHLWFVWSHVVLIGSCHFKSNLQSPHVWPFIRWCSPTTRLFFKAHATLRQYDVTSFYKTEGCFQALARRTGMGGNAWKCIRTCGYIQLYICKFHHSTATSLLEIAPRVWRKRPICPLCNLHGSRSPVLLWKRLGIFFWTKRSIGVVVAIGTGSSENGRFENQ